MKVVYLDVDGVLADFRSAACLAHGWKPNDPSLTGWNFFEKKGITLEQFWKPLDNYDFWFRSVYPYTWAGEVESMAHRIGGQMAFCSTCSRSGQAHAGKIDWIRHQPWYRDQDIILMDKKERLANRNSILIDDNDDNVSRFIAAGGNAILFPQPWNAFGREISGQDEIWNLGQKARQFEPGESVSGEIRVTDPQTGGQKGSKLARFDLIPTGPLWELAEHYGKGAAKYADRNYEKGYAWSLSYAAAQRHLNQFWRGEDIDKETGTRHVIAAAWHCLALALFMVTHPAKDDRVKEKS